MNQDDPLQSGSVQLRFAVRAMQEIAVAEVSEPLLRQAHAAMLEAARRRALRFRRRWLAAAALVAIGVSTLALLPFGGAPAVAMAQVAERVGATKSVRCMVVSTAKSGTLLSRGSRTRFEITSGEGAGAIEIADSTTGRHIRLVPKSKLFYDLPDGPELPEFYDIIRKLAAAAVTPIEPYVDEAGRRFPGFRGQIELEVGHGGRPTVDADVWTDPRTRLPVRLEIWPVDHHRQRYGKPAVLDRFEFDVPLQGELFDVAIPAGYLDTTAALAAPRARSSDKDDAKLNMVPGVGIGEAKFGMTREQVIAVLGEPDEKQPNFIYNSKCLLLRFTDGPEGKLNLIAGFRKIGTATSPGLDFPGQTDKGIHIGSTEQEVIDAYGDSGQPTASGRGLNVRIYQEFGLQIGVVGGTVTSIAIQAK